MAAIQVTMDSFKYDENTVHLDWPVWRDRYENFLVLTNIDVTVLAQAATALRHLIHAGGNKILEIYVAQGNAALLYDQFITILNALFVMPVNKLHVITLRNYVQLPGQSLEDFITILQRLAINAGIAAVNRDAEILTVFAQNTNSEEIRTKALTPDITLGQLKIWHAAQESVSRCNKIIQTKSDASQCHQPSQL